MSSTALTRIKPGQLPSTRDGKRETALAGRVDSRQSRYLAYSVVLEEAGSPRLMRLAMLTVTFVVGAFLTWSAFTPIKEHSVTFGQVLPAGKIQTIQHLEGGIVRRINVSDGDPVEAGAVLLTLDPASASAELEQFRARQASLQLEMERLRAFGAGREPNFDHVSDEYDALKQDQWAIYDQEIASLISQRSVIEAQMEQRRAEVDLFLRQADELQEDVRLLEDELAIRRDLFERGLDSRLRVVGAQRELNNSRSEMTRVDGERLRAEEAIIELRQRLVELDDRLRKEALASMGQVGAELAQVNEALLRVTDRVARLDVVAPVGGIVQGLNVTTVGGVIAPGAPLMDIVPVNDDLEVETKISTRDIGHVAVGQDVTVKVVTYDFARYGGIDGKLTTISASTFVDENGQPYYRGKVSLDKNYVGVQPGFNVVQPGMTVQADITTGQKTLFEYLMKPIYATVDSAFAER